MEAAARQSPKLASACLTLIGYRARFAGNRLNEILREPMQSRLSRHLNGAKSMVNGGSKPEEMLALQIKAVKLPAPVREYRFCNARRWRFDFAWPEMYLAVEVEGGTATNGRHVRPKGFEGDCEKYNEAAVYGWTVLRFTSDMVKRGEALTMIERAMDVDF